MRGPSTAKAARTSRSGVLQARALRRATPPRPEAVGLPVVSCKHQSRAAATSGACAPFSRAHQNANRRRLGLARMNRQNRDIAEVAASARRARRPRPSARQIRVKMPGGLQHPPPPHPRPLQRSTPAQMRSAQRRPVGRRILRGGVERRVHQHAIGASRARGPQRQILQRPR